MYVYIQSEPQLWTTGFYDHNDKWHPDQDFGSPEEAAKRTGFLNGSNALPDPEKEASQTTERIVVLMEKMVYLLQEIRTYTARIK